MQTLPFYSIKFLQPFIERIKLRYPYIDLANSKLNRYFLNLSNSYEKYFATEDSGEIFFSINNILKSLVHRSYDPLVRIGLTKSIYDNINIYLAKSVNIFTLYDNKKATKLLTGLTKQNSEFGYRIRFDYIDNYKIKKLFLFDCLPNCLIKSLFLVIFNKLTLNDYNFIDKVYEVQYFTASGHEIILPIVNNNGEMTIETFINNKGVYFSIDKHIFRLCLLRILNLAEQPNYTNALSYFGSKLFTLYNHKFVLKCNCCNKLPAQYNIYGSLELLKDPSSLCSRCYDEFFNIIIIDKELDHICINIVHDIRNNITELLENEAL